MKLLDSPFREFTKRIDPDLPFYYNASNVRFSTAVLPFFDEAPSDSGDHDEETKVTPQRIHSVYTILFKIEGTIHQNICCRAVISSSQKQNINKATISPFWCWASTCSICIADFCTSLARFLDFHKILWTILLITDKGYEVFVPNS